MTHILSTRPLTHYRLRFLEANAATADVPATPALPSLSFAATVAAIVLVAVDLRPGIVSIGPLLPLIVHATAFRVMESDILARKHFKRQDAGVVAAVRLTLTARTMPFRASSASF